MDLPDLPAEGEPFLPYTRSQCQQCGALQPAWRHPDARLDEQFWEAKHHDETGHRSFFLYTFSRRTCRLWKF